MLNQTGLGHKLSRDHNIMLFKIWRLKEAETHKEKDT